MAEGQLDPLVLAEVGDPVPAEETLDSYGQILAAGFEDAEELVAIAGELLVSRVVLPTWPRTQR